MSAAARLNELTAEAANALPAAEVYKIIEAGILSELGPSATTVTANVLHSIVREIVLAWNECPTRIRNSEWFRPRSGSNESLAVYLRQNSHLFSDEFRRRHQHLLVEETPNPAPVLDSPASPPTLFSPASPPSDVTLSPVRALDSTLDTSTDAHEDDIETDDFTVDGSFDTEPFIDPVADPVAPQLLQAGLLVLRGTRDPSPTQH
jgi:hypothetical protein